MSATQRNATHLRHVGRLERKLAGARGAGALPTRRDHHVLVASSARRVATHHLEVRHSHDGVDADDAVDEHLVGERKQPSSVKVGGLARFGEKTNPIQHATTSPSTGKVSG